ncbi:hypothetical protein [Polymorphospora rubra]|uniref:hypothetical protein n=1 Tax=Polymorphospora rubra TaxID=338584 RepID=UPI0031E1CEAA
MPQPASILVEAYEGSGAYGDVYGPATTVDGCVVEDTRRLVRVQTQDAAGAEQVSQTTVAAPPGTVAPPGSRVTVRGRTTRVLVASWLDAHGHDLPEHWELALE